MAMGNLVRVISKISPVNLVLVLNRLAVRPTLATNPALGTSKVLMGNRRLAIRVVLRVSRGLVGNLKRHLATRAATRASQGLADHPRHHLVTRVVLRVSRGLVGNLKRRLAARAATRASRDSTIKDHIIVKAALANLAALRANKNLAVDRGNRSFHRQARHLIRSLRILDHCSRSSQDTHRLRVHVGPPTSVTQVIVNNSHLDKIKHLSPEMVNLVS